jgi:hypothetical protein
MNHRSSKAGLNQLLRLAAIVIVLTHVWPLQAQEPPAPATPYGPQLRPSDPLTPLNAAFRTAYASLRNQVLAKSSPIIIQIGDRMVLLKNGVRTEAPALSYRYHELKAVVHVPLALYVMLVPGADSKLDEAQLNKLREYRALVVQARASLEGRDFRPEQRKRQLRMIDRSLAFIDTTLRIGRVSEAALRQFTLSQSEDVQANIYEAAEDQIHTMDKQLQAWLAEMTPAERKRLRVVVGAGHMPRIGNLAMQYFSVGLGEPYEGHYEEEEERNNDFRLIYGESMFEEQDALRVLATHLLDADVGVYFFNDAQRMHRDLLGDAAEEIIRKKFGKTPAARQ